MNQIILTSLTLFLILISIVALIDSYNRVKEEEGAGEFKIIIIVIGLAFLVHISIMIIEAAGVPEREEEFLLRRQEMMKKRQYRMD